MAQVDEHYFYRPGIGADSVGPLTKEMFMSLQARGVIKEDMTAWRTCGGNGYKIIISRKFRCDRDHVCSGAALALVVEALMLCAFPALVLLVFLKLDFHKLFKHTSTTMCWILGIGAAMALTMLTVVSQVLRCCLSFMQFLRR